jgi:hypothetical protein
MHQTLHKGTKTQLNPIKLELIKFLYINLQIPILFKPFNFIIVQNTTKQLKELFFVEKSKKTTFVLSSGELSVFIPHRTKILLIKVTKLLVVF